jgi:glycosyltransferase involved in cell wall biosynthesis
VDEDNSIVKMKSLKISFLIAAHNEEKIIKKTLNNLLHLPYDNYEVILGLDGCTDETEQIVKSYCKKSRKFKYYNFNLRQGKPAVINMIIKKAKGEIIIINDADWIFHVENRKVMKDFVSIFNDEKIGGITESFPVEWDKYNLKDSNSGYKMTAYSSYFWLEFQKKNYTYEREGKVFLKEPGMFLTNIFRKKLYQPNTSLGDDFERTTDILNQGYDLQILKDENMPRFIATYNKISIGDLFKQKVRTAKAREQIKKDNESINLFYYLRANSYILTRGFLKNPYIGMLMLFWFILTVNATIKSKFKKFGTKEGWKLRVKR